MPSASERPPLPKAIYVLRIALCLNAHCTFTCHLVYKIHCAFRCHPPNAAIIKHVVPFLPIHHAHITTTLQKYRCDRRETRVIYNLATARLTGWRKALIAQPSAAVRTSPARPRSTSGPEWPRNKRQYWSRTVSRGPMVHYFCFFHMHCLFAAADGDNNALVPDQARVSASRVTFSDDDYNDMKAEVKDAFSISLIPPLLFSDGANERRGH